MIAKKLGLLFILSVMVLTSGACGWSPGEDWQMGVWSDDEENIVMVKRFFESKQNAVTTSRRNFQFEIWQSTPEAPNSKTQFVEKTVGKPLDMYYMHSQNYLLVARRLTINSDEVLWSDHVAWDKVSMDGSRVTIGEKDSPASFINLAYENVPLAFVPSPDGFSLAKVEATTDSAVLVSFLDSETLAVFDGPHSVPVGAYPNETGWVKPAWLADGVFVLSHQEPNGNVNYWMLGNGSGATPAGSLDESCFSPATSSSAWSAEGVQVRCLSEGNVVVGTEGVSYQFGCD